LAGTLNLHNSLWRQGAVLPRELLDPGTLPSDLDPTAKLVIISHDCDIVHPSYEGEPFVELFLAYPVQTSESLKRKGKNPRRLQFLAIANGSPQWYEINVHDKLRVSRKLLEGKTPDSSCDISKAAVKDIARWAGKRYNRPAFPTEFDRRLSAVGKKKFEQAIRKYGDDVSWVFIAFLSASGELPESEPYQIVVRVVAPQDAVSDASRSQVLSKLVSELWELLGRCEGIDVQEIKLDGEAEFTLEDWKNSTVWDYEFISEEESGHAYLAGS
jgi:hypothetical protein